MRNLGVDLHSDSFVVCYMEESGKCTYKQYPLKKLTAFKKTLRATDRMAVEATGNTRFFYDSVASVVEKFVVVNPGQFEVIKKSTNKTDKNDAKSLALFLSKDLLPEARMKDKAQAQMSSLVGTRDKLVKLRTTLINKLHGILNAHGIKSEKEAFGSEAGLRRVLSLKFDELVQIELEVIVSQVRHLNEGIRRLDEQITEHGKKMEGHKNLTSIKGIGDKSAAILLSVVGDIGDFDSEAKLCSYFGIVPRVRPVEPDAALWADHETRIEVGTNHAGAMHIDRHPVQPLPAPLL